MEDEIKKTDIWDKYQRGVNYNRSKDIYTTTKQNYNLYNSKHWDDVDLGDMQPVTLNFTKTIVKYKLGVVNSNEYQIMFNMTNTTVTEFKDEMVEIAKSLNRHMKLIWEDEQGGRKSRECLKDSAINSEGIFYKYLQDDKVKIEVIDKTNICYGNENEPEIQEQPYIIISFRRPVADIEAEALENGKKITIASDDEYREQAGMDNTTEELTPMALELLYLYKKDGIVHSKKSTMSEIIQDEASLKIDRYPVSHIVWEDEKGNARGIGEVEQLRPNQIEVDKTIMRRAITVKRSAYPKLIANIRKIANKDDIDKVGVTIEVDDGTVEDVNNVIGYTKVSMMSPDSKTFQEELINGTRDLASAGDTATGAIDPERASGKAILAIQQASQQPLTEQKMKFITFHEDTARNIFALLKSISEDGLEVIMDEKELGQDGQPTGKIISNAYVIPKRILEKFTNNLTIETTPKGPFDRFAKEQSWENLLNSQQIKLEEYASGLDDDSVMPKDKLMKILEERAAVRAEIAKQQEMINQDQMGVEAELQNQQEGLSMEMPEEVPNEMR